MPKTKKSSSKKQPSPLNKVEAAPQRVHKTLQISKDLNPQFAAMDDATSVLKFLEEFQKLANPANRLPSKLISIKIPLPLLNAFRFKANQMGVPYQTMIKKLMEEWLGSNLR
ncbi:MAG: CopG family antitoxin [Proteobacteria bacterium]|nr:CopG family antitoxin [Pseudomonadota bacterium]